MNCPLILSIHVCSRKRHLSPFARSISKPYHCCSVVVVGIRHRKGKGLKDFCSYVLRLLAGRRDRPYVTRTLLLFFCEENLLCKKKNRQVLTFFADTFYVNGTSLLLVNNTLDYESKRGYNISVSCIDSGSPPLSIQVCLPSCM